MNYPKLILTTTFDILKILKAPTELEKIGWIEGFLIRHHSNLYFEALFDPALKVLLKFLLSFPNFFSKPSFGSKILLGRIAVVNDDLEALVQMSQMDVNILMDKYDGEWPLFELAAIRTKNRIIQLMINLVPEIAFCDKTW